jgi:hypothetical protein
VESAWLGACRIRPTVICGVPIDALKAGDIVAIPQDQHGGQGLTFSEAHGHGQPETSPYGCQGLADAPWLVCCQGGCHIPPCGSLSLQAKRAIHWGLAVVVKVDAASRGQGQGLG